MNYEKAYKQALEKAKELLDTRLKEGEQGEFHRKDLEDIFPELKESDDERILEIIKHCIESRYLHTSTIKGISQKECFAWLEKQAEQKSIINVPSREVILSIWYLGNEWKELTNGSISTEYGTQLDYIQKHWRESEYYLREKQGANSVSVTKGNTSVTNAEVVSHPTVSTIIEPKFKVGDWVVKKDGEKFFGGSKVTQITKIDKEQYWFDCGTWLEDEDIRLWTIEDAKDGDVLVNGSNIFIFHFINDTRLMGYCHINTDDGIFYNDLGKNECFCLVDAIVTPATKEQRDLLFQIMKEAGYEWDAEKKELKKISQRMVSAEVKEAMYDKPSWSEEDKPQKELAETYLTVFDKKFPILPTLKGKQLADYKNFLNKCQQIFGLKYWGIHPTQAKLFEKLSLLWAAWGAEHLQGLRQTDGDVDNERKEWSEEDEHRVKDTIYFLDTAKKHYASTVELDACIDWLKSLRPQ